jgi:hypothetical protein
LRNVVRADAVDGDRSTQANVGIQRRRADKLEQWLEQCREGPAELARLQKLAIAQDLRELKKRRESAKK